MIRTTPTPENILTELVRRLNDAHRPVNTILPMPDIEGMEDDSRPGWIFTTARDGAPRSYVIALAKGDRADDFGSPDSVLENRWTDRKAELPDLIRDADFRYAFETLVVGTSTGIINLSADAVATAIRDGETDGILSSFNWS